MSLIAPDMATRLPATAAFAAPVAALESAGQRPMLILDGKRLRCARWEYTRTLPSLKTRLVSEPGDFWSTRACVDLTYTDRDGQLHAVRCADPTFERLRNGRLLFLFASAPEPPKLP